MYQAIVTKYYAPTNYRGARVGAVTGGNRRIVLDWDDSLNAPDNHIRAARTIAGELNWDGHWYGGSLPDSGYAFVLVLDSKATDFVVLPCA